MKRLTVALVAGLVTLASPSCSDSTDPATRAQFTFRDPLTQDVVRLEITNPQGLDLAEDLLRSGVAVWAIGTPRRGDGGFNAPWTWHIDPASVTFAEVTIEACQTVASAIDDDLDYWINFGQVCVWGVVETRIDQPLDDRRR
jgi:hypothetical protein